MASETGIEWTDVTWNPVVGCTPVSSGCLNCYAARMSRRLEAMGKPEYQPRHVLAVLGTPYDPHEPAKVTRIAEVRAGRPVFTGDVRLVPERLTDPMRWKKPRRVFVNSMSDLFHEAVPFEFIDRVFAVMALCPQHTFQVLTKRPERMAEYLAQVPVAHLQDTDDRSLGGFRWEGGRQFPEWPLRNVQLGTSVENQQAADERIPHLLACPAAVRFLSLEPLLGLVDLHTVPWKHGGMAAKGWSGVLPVAEEPDDYVYWEQKGAIGWLIIGGESGPGARCHAEYEARARSIIQQAAEASVPAFHKQMPIWTGKKWRVSHDPSEWPADMRVRQWPGGVA